MLVPSAFVRTVDWYLGVSVRAIRMHGDTYIRLMMRSGIFLLAMMLVVRTRMIMKYAHQYRSHLSLLL